METTLGNRIMANRKRIGLTQDKLAEKLGVTAQAVSKWENDQSCPDISMLPKLADIFGISTDVLLGVENTQEQPVLEAEVVSEEDAPGIHVDSDSAGMWEMHWDAGRKNGVGVAVWVLLTGGLLLASNLLHWDAGLWDILWPTALTVFGAFGLMPRFSFFRLGCMLFGAYFLLTNLGLASVLPGKEILLPALIVLLGLSMLADALRSGKVPRFTVTQNGKSTAKRNGAQFSSEFKLSEEGFSAATGFGELRRTVVLPRLAEGRASVSFGELTLDLTGCQSFAEDCRIYAKCSFGELKLIVPEWCRVEPDSHTVFAEMKVRGQPLPEAKAVIRLEGDVSFGEITVRYV